MALFNVTKKDIPNSKKAKSPTIEKVVEQPAKRSREDNRVISLIKRKRLQMLVHSCIYYRLNESIISDEKWYEMAYELRDLQIEYPELSKVAEWADAFEGWDGTTGYDLPLGDQWVMQKACYILKIHKLYEGGRD